MSSKLFSALEVLEKEKGIPAEYILDKIKTAIITTVKKYYDAAESNVVVEMDMEKQKFSVVVRKQVVEEVLDRTTEISLEEALEFSKRAKLDKFIDIKIDTKQFGRIAAQTAKHIIKQGIREGERNSKYEELQSRKGDIVTATIVNIDPDRGNVTVEMGKNELMIPKSELIPNEVLKEGDLIKIYIADVTNNEKGYRAIISRTNVGLVSRLFELEVPEIHDGTVEIKAVAREAGSRSKIAVFAKDENVDPVGSCIGLKRSRITKVVDELSGEKIDVVKYSEVPEEYIASALSPSDVVSVEIIEEKICRVIVPDNQLSLAIGNKGQNVRLAARLTGFKIDIKPQSDLINLVKNEEVVEKVVEEPAQDEIEIFEEVTQDEIEVFEETIED